MHVGKFSCVFTLEQAAEAACSLHGRCKLVYVKSPPTHPALSCVKLFPGSMMGRQKHSSWFQVLKTLCP